MKILYIITQGEMGGAQKYVYDLATHLSSDYSITVAVGSENSGLTSLLEKHNIKTITLPRLVRNIHPLKDVLSLWDIFHLVRKERPDIVHLNSSKSGVLGSIGAKLAGAKAVIFTAHGLAFLEPKSLFVKKIYYWAEKISMPFKDMVITVSDYDKDKAREYKLGKQEKFITIHNGVDFGKLNFLPKEKAREDLCQMLDVRCKMSTSSNDSGSNVKCKMLNAKGQRSNVFIGTVANLYKTKGLEYLVDAAKKIINHNPDICFMVIGEGGQRKFLESKIKTHNLTDNFFLLGQIQDASCYLKAFDIFVLPSIKEGFPYTILEAGAAGLPIIASRIGGIPEILNDESGILVEPGDPEALAREIITLSKDTNKKESLGNKACSSVKKFTIENMVNQTLALYQN